MLLPESAIDAVGEQDEIGIGKARLVVDIHFEMEVDTELARSLLQDQQQFLPRAAAKAVTPDPMHRAAKMHGDIIPIGELLGDAAVARKVVLFEIVERGVREHHAEAERVVGAVALIDGDIGAWALLLE